MASQYTQAALLAILDRLLPAEYIEPLRDKSGPGYELLQAAAKMWERMSLAVCRLDNDHHFLTAPVGSFATGYVRLKRTNTVGAVTLRAGTVFSTSSGGRRFVLTEDVTFADGETGDPTKGYWDAPVRSLYKAYDHNVTGQVITRTQGGLVTVDALPADIDTIESIIQLDATTSVPAFIDGTVEISNDVYNPSPGSIDLVTGPSGGEDPALAQLGADRGLVQRPGEPAASFRTRVRSLPDSVTPEGIFAAISAIMVLYGEELEFYVIEGWSPSYTSCWDATLGSTYDNSFVFDDTRDPDPFMNRWVDESETRGCFIVVIPRLGPIEDNTLILDDPITDESELQAVSFVGYRAPGALDVEEGDVSASIPVAVLDGTDFAQKDVVAGIYELLQEIKAGGIKAVLELKGQ